MRIRGEGTTRSRVGRGKAGMGSEAEQGEQEGGGRQIRAGVGGRQTRADGRAKHVGTDTTAATEIERQRGGVNGGGHIILEADRDRKWSK